MLSGPPAAWSLRRVVLPITDHGVVAQLILLIALVLWASWALRERPEWRLVVFGIGLLALGGMGLRAAH